MKIFTTGQVARICSVAPRTVSKWIDGGYLKGYRLPGSNGRRVQYEALLQFLKKHDMPLDGLEEAIQDRAELLQNLKAHGIGLAGDVDDADATTQTI